MADGHKFSVVRRLSGRRLDCSKNASLPTLPAFGAPLGMLPSEFRQNLWRQKTKAPRLSCGVISVTIHLAVLIEHDL